ncbi:tRNA pseudouridine(55) synthase TruB [Nocardioides massiliensis]|uniref:tRNA pseudouridine synthase B n=1 Tax=Nocardioides massiliensis TaxID=1325935 RepID=A0ABT9NQC1_9ACTN|nr:tRNA pseudouridine(55) synthase TruB [Nocardioides massiliensis]MDP9822624.1 tRNA pseudouridine55 synthase [Nocardioides massiliensis]
MSAPAPTGLLVVDKPAGITSHGVVARARKALGTRKIGHAGTLDPMATGVLVLGVGRATRLLGHLMLTEKTYEATMRLGVITTTDDAEGEVVAEADTAHLDEDAVRAALAAYVGEIEQVPTAVSAIKVDGKRAYQRVRDGEEVELKARPVTIHELDVTGVTLPEVSFRVRCSSGTYVRAIARDAGRDLGVGGHLTALRRTAVGPFGLDVAHLPDDLDADALLPMAQVARAAFPTLDLSDDTAQAVRFGRAIDAELEALTALLDPAGEFLALYEPKDGRARPVAVFV